MLIRRKIALMKQKYLIPKESNILVRQYIIKLFWMKIYQLIVKILNVHYA